MKRLRTFNFWIISLLVFSSFSTACAFGNSAQEQFEQGLTNYEAGDYQQAIADFTKAIELDPDYGPAYSTRGEIYDDLGNYEQAIADYSKGIELDPDFGPTYSNRAGAYADLGDYEHAIADYTKAMELDPNDVNACYNRGNAYSRSYNYEQAIADYSQVIALDSGKLAAFAYNNRGSIYHELGELEQAIRDYDSSLELVVLAGVTERQSRAYRDLARELTKAIELEPQAELYVKRGRIHYIRHDFNLAIADYSNAINLDPNYAPAYNNRGLTYTVLRDLEKAIADYEMYLELAPTASDRAEVINKIEDLKSTLGRRSKGNQPGPS